MYGLLLATLMTADNAVLGADIQEDIQELKKSVQELRKQGTEARIDELHETIARLRERLVEEKLDELRRNIRELRNEGIGYGSPPLPFPVPVMPRSQPTERRAVISLRVPAGAAISVNDQPLALPANPVFVSPPLELGRDYFYDFKVSLLQDNKEVVRMKRLTVRPGEAVQLNYEDMEAR